MNELYHHGRKGQQWGVENGPPYPLNKRGLSYYFRRKKITKEDRKRIKEEEAEKKRQKEEEELEKKKEGTLISGKASDVLKYQGKLTNQELYYAVARLDYEKRLKDYSKKEQKTYMEKIDDVMKTVDTMNKWSTIGIQGWNTLVNVHNSLNTSGKKLTPITSYRRR